MLKLLFKLPGEKRPQGKTKSAGGLLLNLRRSNLEEEGRLVAEDTSNLKRYEGGKAVGRGSGTSGLVLRLFPPFQESTW